MVRRMNTDQLIRTDLDKRTYSTDSEIVGFGQEVSAALARFASAHEQVQHGRISNPSLCALVVDLHSVCVNQQDEIAGLVEICRNQQTSIEHLRTRLANAGL